MSASQPSFPMMEWTPTPTPLTPTPAARPTSGIRAVAQPGPVFLAGACIGPYRVVRQIGSGTVGEVYEVEHLDLGRRYALKILSEETRPDGLERRRFDREARVLASIDHPNVLRVHHVDRLSDGRRFLITELLLGRTLAERIKNGRLPVGEACLIAERVAAGLSAAHDQGALHRDLTPANIFLADTEAGMRVKLMDFGLAKVDAAPEDQLTINAEPVGTPGYMAPEQISRTQGLDARADLFALGAVLFEMLTGTPAFVASDADALLAANLASSARDPRELRPEVPRSIAHLTLRCLAKDRAARPESARALGKLLRALRKGTAVKTERRARRIQLSALALLAFGLVAMLVLLLLR